MSKALLKMIKAVPKPEKQLSPDQAMVRLETLCARAEHCTRELRDKLWQWGISEKDSDKIIDSLVDRKFVDDDRYARAFINDKVNFARWGRHKIRASLAAKRIDSHAIDRFMDEIDTNVYLENLKTLIRQKIASGIDAETYEGRAKLFRFAAGRGYEPEYIDRALDSLADS